MPTREEELREVMHRLEDPRYIEKPDELQVDLGGLCFLNRERMCGPDCTAYADAHAPTAAERCLLLNGANAALELLSEFVALKRPASKVAAVDVPPPYDPHLRG